MYTQAHLLICNLNALEVHKGIVKVAAYLTVGFPGGTSGKEPACQRRRCKRVSSSPGREDCLEEVTSELSLKGKPTKNRVRGGEDISDT